MSLRNFMNDRYQGTEEEKTSSTPKRAASAKPKTQAASSVRIDTGKKTPEQKKQEQKAREQKEQETRRKYINPPTRRYKILTRVWIVFLVLALASTIIVGLFQDQLPESVALPLIGLAYFSIIVALILDFGPRRKERNNYQTMMEAKKDRDKVTVKKGGKNGDSESNDETDDAIREVPARRKLFW